MSAAADRRWADALRAHDAAVAEFARRAAEVPAGEWRTPLPGRAWSPAHETVHLALAYEVVAGELRGGPAMRPRLPRWKRAVAGWLMKPRILRTGRMPRGVTAPRELRPADGALADQPVLVERFRVAAADFVAEIARTRAAAPNRRIAHPFFGWLSLLDAVRLAEVHVRHHRAHLS